MIALRVSLLEYRPQKCLNVLSIFLAGLKPRPLGRKERPATSEATLLYRARIGEGMQTPSQSLASSQRDVSLLL